MNANKAAAFPVVVLTGLSGAGKSTALNVFEDLRFFCVDGIPTPLMGKLVEFYAELDPAKYRGLALGIDVRQADFIDSYESAFRTLESLGVIPYVIFVEARTDVILRRYASSRRPHPLEADSPGLEKALEKERDLLFSLKKYAQLIIDTSDFSIHDLRRKLIEKWSVPDNSGKTLRVHLISFGFKYGVPAEADLVMDLRFLPNPYFIPELKPLTGRDKPVSDFVLENEPGRSFIRRYHEFVTYLLPLYAGEGRYRISVALGCTGGRHRSAACAEYLFGRLKEDGYSVTLEHRHMELG